MRKLFLSAVVLFGLTAPALAYTALERDIKANGVGQGDLVKLLQNIVDVVNELADDHVTFVSVTNELKTDLTAVRADTILFASMLDSTGNGQINYTSYTSGTTSTATQGDPPAALTNSTDLTLSAP